MNLYQAIEQASAGFSTRSTGGGAFGNNTGSRIFEKLSQKAQEAYRTAGLPEAILASGAASVKTYADALGVNLETIDVGD